MDAVTRYGGGGRPRRRIITEVLHDIHLDINENSLVPPLGNVRSLLTFS